MCLHNESYPASLEVRKIYATVPDAPALRQGMLRVVDESGDDYLYPADHFSEIELPARIAKLIAPDHVRQPKS